MHRVYMRWRECAYCQLPSEEKISLIFYNFDFIIFICREKGSQMHKLAECQLNQGVLFHSPF